jgi:putative SOS response-associated peptidase YedK
VTAFSLEELVDEVRHIANGLLTDIQIQPDHGPLFENYNVAPTHSVPVISFEQGAVIVGRMQWGLVPSWSKDPSIGSKMINARSETVTEKPSFKNLVARHRCVVPMNGFYEWNRDEPKSKVPYFVPRADGEMMLVSGLWNNSPALGNTPTFTMLTQESGDDLAQIHHRSPVEFSRQDANLWLTDDDNALALIRAAQQPVFAPFVVSTQVNSVKNNHSGLIEKTDPIPQELNTLF